MDFITYLWRCGDRAKCVHQFDKVLKKGHQLKDHSVHFGAQIQFLQKKMSHYRNTNIRSIPKIPWMSKVHRRKGIHSKLYIIAIFILKYLERFNSKKKAPVHYGVLTWSVLHTAVPCPPSPRDSCLMDDLITSKLQKEKQEKCQYLYVHFWFSIFLFSKLQKT